MVARCVFHGNRKSLAPSVPDFVLFDFGCWLSGSLVLPHRNECKLTHWLDFGLVCGDAGEQLV
jgi:hypothetical protein